MRKRVLVVEDDDSLRWLVTEAVTYLGYEVTECSSADEALLKLENNQPFELVITDVRMPGQHDGLGLANSIWTSRPKLPVIIVSANATLQPDLLPVNARFLTKPYTLDVLAHTIAELI